MALNFQQRNSAFVRRVVFAALLIVCIALLVVYSQEEEDGVLHSAQSMAAQIVSPIKYLGSFVESATDSVSDGIDDMTASDETLTSLTEYNALLIEQYTQMEEYRLENERLTELLEMKDTYDIDGVGATVIGRSSEAWSQTITIDKGTSDGVENGLTVMSSSGVIGQVVGVTSSTATVRLLTDPASGAAAMVQSSRAEGIVYGSLEGLLYLENIDIDVEINVGDVIITSGLGGSYVKGLIIGTVVSIDESQDDSTRRAVVSPNAEASTLEEVLVVFSVVSDSEEEDE